MTYPTLEQQYVEAIETGNHGRRVRLEAELDAQGASEDARLSAPDALTKAALWYARQGIAVFPCYGVIRTGEPPYACACGDPQRGSPGKHPLTSRGLHDATTDLDTVAAWWQATPGANIGLPTGQKFDVLDIDGREGVASVYLGDDPLQYEEIGHVLTPRTAGHHIYVPAVPGRRNRAQMLPGVDFRTLGGYVIAPPSVGANGVRYRWTRPLRFESQAAA